MPVTHAIVAIALGAAAGANLRWALALALNASLPQLPLGTLTANLAGAFLIGLALPAFAAWPGISPFWKLFVVTGFLGALTTFSTFSAEIMDQLQAGRMLWAFAGIAAHVVGSLAMTGLGMAVFVLLRR